MEKGLLETRWFFSSKRPLLSHYLNVLNWIKMAKPGRNKVYALVSRHLLKYSLLLLQAARNWKFLISSNSFFFLNELTPNTAYRRADSLEKDYR